MSKSLTLMVLNSLIFLSMLFNVSNENNISNTLRGCIIYTLIFLGQVILFQYNLSIVKRIIISSDDYIDIRKITEKIKIDHSELIEENDLFKEKYQKSRITPEELQDYMTLVQKALEDKIYLDTELTLDKFSKSINIPKYHLTQVFTLGFHKNFNKVINKYRIDYAIILLKDAESKLNIEQIGLESGFNSRSSFYRVFNAYYNITPIDYRKNYFNKKKQMK